MPSALARPWADTTAESAGVNPEWLWTHSADLADAASSRHSSKALACGGGRSGSGGDSDVDDDGGSEAELTDPMGPAAPENQN